MPSKQWPASNQAILWLQPSMLMPTTLMADCSDRLRTYWALTVMTYLSSGYDCQWLVFSIPGIIYWWSILFSDIITYCLLFIEIFYKCILMKCVCLFGWNCCVTTLADEANGWPLKAPALQWRVKNADLLIWRGKYVYDERSILLKYPTAEALYSWLIHSEERNSVNADW